MSIMGQTSRCCMVCLMPQSHVSCSLENPHFSIFTLDRPTCERNRLRAFQVVQGFSAPAGRCSSGLMLRCTLASRGSSRSLHSSMRAAFVVVLMGSVHLMKLFRDFRRGTTPRCPLSGCLWSVICRVRSVRLATALLMSDGAIPASMGRLLVFVGFRQPVIIRQVSFSVTSSFFAWVERSHTGQAFVNHLHLFNDSSYNHVLVFLVTMLNRIINSYCVTISCSFSSFRLSTSAVSSANLRLAIFLGRD